MLEPVDTRAAHRRPDDHTSSTNQNTDWPVDRNYDNDGKNDG
jgi:hypothetical protein